MSKKIGIITLSASENCGSLLQTYALKKIIEKCNEAEVINFTTIKSHEQYDIFPKRIYRNSWEILKRIRHIGKLLNEKKAYQKFRKKYIGITGKELFPKDLTGIADKYDLVVTGSDQIWNVCMGDFDEAFFAGWAKCKKVAYAPSLGGYDIRESNNSKQIVAWLNEFQSLSVRENLGKKCLEEITDRKVELVLDPTLMLDEADWKALVGEPIVTGEYFFYYSWAYCYDQLSGIVAEDARKSNMPVYVVDAHKWLHQQNTLKNYNFSLCKEAGPLAFLNLMYYAKKCYVESFHGLIFSYIFKKNVWILNLTNDLEKDDIRLYELSKLLKMENRVLSEFNVHKKDLDEPIDYQENECVNELRRKSKDYIRREIEE